MSVISPENFVMLKFSYKDFKSIQKNYRKFYDINSKKYIAVYKKGLYGILDIETEKLVLPPKYQKICDFKEGYAWVKEKGKWGFIDEDLNEVVSPRYMDVFGLDNGIFDLGVINCTGEPVYPETSVELQKWYRKNRSKNPKLLYNRIEGFSEGLTPIKLRKKWGFVDTTGKIRIKARYDKVKPFAYGVAAVCINNKWGFINEKGQFIIKAQFVDCSSFMKTSQGLVKNSKKSNNVIMKYLYSLFQKVYTTKDVSMPYAQVELPTDDLGRIKIAQIDMSGNFTRRPSKKDIEVHAVIY